MFFKNIFDYIIRHMINKRDVLVVIPVRGKARLSHPRIGRKPFSVDFAVCVRIEEVEQVMNVSYRRRDHSAFGKIAHAVLLLVRNGISVKTEFVIGLLFNFRCRHDGTVSFVYHEIVG